MNTDRSWRCPYCGCTELLEGYQRSDGMMMPRKFTMGIVGSNHSVYCGTKYAVHAMTESMRREVSGSNVRMIVIAPGVVETPLLSHTSNQEIKDNYNLWKQEIDGGLEPSQIADCAWFAYQMPQEVCVREIVIAKTKQAD